MYSKTFREFFKENNTPQLAIEKTQIELPVEIEKIHPGVIYDTSLENALSKMKKQKDNIKEKKMKMDKCFGMEHLLKERVIQEVT